MVQVGSIAVFVLRHKDLVGGGRKDLQHIAQVIALNMVKVSFPVSLLILQSCYFYNSIELSYHITVRVGCMLVIIARMNRYFTIIFGIALFANYYVVYFLFFVGKCLLGRSIVDSCNL